MTVEYADIDPAGYCKICIFTLYFRIFLSESYYMPQETKGLKQCFKAAGYMTADHV